MDIKRTYQQGVRLEIKLDLRPEYGAGILIPTLSARLAMNV